MSKQMDLADELENIRKRGHFPNDSLIEDVVAALRSSAGSEHAQEALDAAIQRHASAYVNRGAAISDSIIAECKASREALVGLFPTPQAALAWPKEEIEPGRFVDVDPEVIAAADKTEALRKQAFALSCHEQFRLASFVAENLGYVLAPEPEHPDSPHARSQAVCVDTDLLEALRSVQKLISEAAMTGFNCHDGDWAERLFHSQQATSAAIKKAALTRLELEQSCNTALRCQCGSQSFRIFMEVNEDNNELSPTDANGVECDGCHELFQIKLVRDDPSPIKQAMTDAAEKAVMKYPYFTAREAAKIAEAVVNASTVSRPQPQVGIAK